ncbi:hypothetical protein [Nonomuraea sp. NPDC050202]|uniref:hypothetical protein n=1 Tax=Nonomuraea sp. NPDC050202 TaxID=3155035 RepID=UPI003405A862
MNELALTESPSLRAQYADRVEVLDKVKAVSLLPDGIHADIPTVARYYEVSTSTIDSVIRRNREELTDNGLRVLKGDEYREFATVNTKIANSNARSITVFTRRTILNVGQLLADSPIAKAVRTYLLDVEEIASPEQRSEAVERAVISREQIKMLKAATGLVDADWLGSKAKVVIARGLGEQPEIDPADVPLYVPDYLKGKGLTKDQIKSVQSWFGRRVAKVYEMEHGRKPGKRPEETPTGAIRETLAWTKRDLPVFDKAWTLYYADEYERPSELTLLDGGAS